jgi:hypothetical protein
MASAYANDYEEFGLDVIESYTAIHYGPLSFHEADRNHQENFMGGSYSMARASSSDGLIVNRLYDNQNAGPLGQYFTLDKREGNLGTMIDLAIHPSWNRMSQSRSLWIPQGFAVFIGRASSQRTPTGGHLLGGGLQVFIPNAYLNYIQQAQSGDSFARMNAIRNGLAAQNTFLENYSSKSNEVSKSYLDAYLSKTNLASLSKNGNNVKNLPQAFRDALQKKNEGQSIAYKNPDDYPKGNYLIHAENLHLPNGKVIQLKLNSQMRYDGATTRSYTSGRTQVTETTHHYTIIYEWS